jgi:hypothetical protein
MQDDVFQDVLELLHEARRAHSHDAHGRADELVALAVDRLEKGRVDQRISKREYLDLLTRLLTAVPPAAKLIDTVLQQFR